MFSTNLLRLSANLDAEHAQDTPAAPLPQTLQVALQPPPQPIYPQQPLYYLPYPVDNLAMMQYNLLFLQQAHAQRPPSSAPAPRGNEGGHHHHHQPRHATPIQCFQSRRGGGHPLQKRRSEEDEEEVVEDKLALTGLLSKAHQSKEELEKWVRARRLNFPTRENILRKQQAAERDGEAGKMKESELSVLEVKLRKKLTILDYNPHEEKRLQRERKSLLHRINSRKRLLGSFPPGEDRPAQDAPHPDRKHRKDKRADRKTQLAPEDPGRPDEEPRKPRAHTAQDIIEHLQARRLEDDNAISSFIRDKPQTDRFKHQQHSLLSHLLLADIYRERSIVLQAVRHLVKHDFLQPPQPKD